MLPLRWVLKISSARPVDPHTHFLVGGSSCVPPGFPCRVKNKTVSVKLFPLSATVCPGMRRKGKQQHGTPKGRMLCIFFSITFLNSVLFRTVANSPPKCYSSILSLLRCFERPYAILCCLRHIFFQKSEYSAETHEPQLCNNKLVHAYSRKSTNSTKQQLSLSAFCLLSCSTSFKIRKYTLSVTFE